ncbi:uncharacterized protein N7483_011100 [Penicillium malachiteum]|uniref:uncharacterized protein n=1 Tax=Penicillium malachiteum TaxID=1324776 RepID=UPI002547E267|nr:uncharacterized protein N7483_011100 [Penicillium malachiteum]KAJ5713919.1 hypothetical protein N7483_011100 [Penicillium malachiteum]
MVLDFSNKPHLFEDELVGDADAERKLFAKWASSVSFKKKADDFEIHESDELGSKLTIFLQQLGLQGKVYIPL